MPSVEGLSLWPWWLWTLSALWIGALLFWQPSGTVGRERWGWGAFALVYAILILFGGRIAPASPTETARDSWLLWLGMLMFLIGSVASVGLRTPWWQQIACAVTTLGAGVSLAVLQAPEAALACGVIGMMMARKSAVVAVFDPQGALPRQNHWLAGGAAVVTLVAIIGLVRYALIVESSRIGPSRWQTVFPTPAQVAKYASDSEKDRNPLPVPLELWGLVALAALAAFSRTGAQKNEGTSREMTA